MTAEIQSKTEFAIATIIVEAITASWCTIHSLCIARLTSATIFSSDKIHQGYSHQYIGEKHIGEKPSLEEIQSFLEADSRETKQQVETILHLLC